MKDTSIAVFVSNDFHWELTPFFTLFNRFWSEEQPVDIITIRNPIELPYENLSYIRMGNDDILVNNDWHFGRYSDGIIWYLNQLKTPLVIILNSDYWLTEAVDLGTLDVLIDYMLEHPDVLRIQIGDKGSINDCTVPCETYQGVELRDCSEDNPSCFLKVSWIPGIWNRDLLAALLQPGWNPWQCEVDGSEKLKTLKSGLRSLGCSTPIIRYIHAISTRQNRADLHIVPVELVEDIRPLLPEDMEVN